MGRCKVCGRESRLVSEPLGLCAVCVRESNPRALARAEAIHRSCRQEFGLPTEPPADGLLCGWCVNNCRIPDGGRGYCAVRSNRGGTLYGGTATDGLVSWYHDPLPTNCVAD